MNTPSFILLTLIILILLSSQPINCNIINPPPTRTIYSAPSFQAQSLTAVSSPTQVPHVNLSKREDNSNIQENLELYQNWASICRNGQTDILVAPAMNESVYNLWQTVTQTVNCGGGHAKTVTKTVLATPTAASQQMSCNDQCWSDYLWHTYGDGVSPVQGFTGVVCIIIGLYFSIFGFRFFRPTLVFVGFVFFATMTWIGLANNEPAGGYPLGDVIYICVCAGLGLLGALLLSFVYQIGVICLACLGGFYFAVFLLSWKPELVISLKVARVCFIIGMSLLGPFISYFIETIMVIFSTSLIGSYLFYFGLDFFAHTGFINPWLSIFDGNPAHHNIYLVNQPVYIMLAFVIVSLILSFGWQYYYNIIRLKLDGFGTNNQQPAPKEEPEKDAKEDLPPAYVCLPPPYYGPSTPQQPMFVQNVTAIPHHHMA